MGDLRPQLPSRWPVWAPLWVGEKADEGLARGNRDVGLRHVTQARPPLPQHPVREIHKTAKHNLL